MRKLTKPAFKKLRYLGHYLGMSLVIAGFALSFSYARSNFPFFLIGFILYWAINYWFVRGIVETKYVEK